MAVNVHLPPLVTPGQSFPSDTYLGSIHSWGTYTTKRRSIPTRLAELIRPRPMMSLAALTMGPKDGFAIPHARLVAVISMHNMYELGRPQGLGRIGRPQGLGRSAACSHQMYAAAVSTKKDVRDHKNNAWQGNAATPNSATADSLNRLPRHRSVACTLGELMLGMDVEATRLLGWQAPAEIEAYAPPRGKLWRPWRPQGVDSANVNGASSSGVTSNTDMGNTLAWPPARRFGSEEA